MAIALPAKLPMRVALTPTTKAMSVDVITPWTISPDGSMAISKARRE
jgi:hypothetical protein